MMYKPFLLALALAAMLGCQVSGALAQGTATQSAAADAAAIAAAGVDPAGGSRGLIEMCGERDEEGNLTKQSKKRSAPCNEYIAANFGSSSDQIITTLNAIDTQKDRARAEARYNKYWDRWLSGTLIVLAFLTTLFAAIARTYKNDKYPRLQRTLGLIPIALSAFVTMFATFNAYYKFDTSRSQNSFVADELAKLQTEIGFYLIDEVGKTIESGAQLATLDFERLQGWRRNLETIMSNYRPAKKGAGKPAS